ncbi:hypothetical protein UA08_01896 [Talaromyces atroroseus]|uniref:Uncharacterized protein n=1 Tax=Talaromyces atroroseus TaxID=1441469 RepID=A0A1Q5Q9W4_TALAT|nr:hypothetical protein UA08_01896 [Talaromyces atroroseus]OKL62724.1 hypothetical protein UA08_01896 [Talaromyces atroroseus]
MIHVWQLLTVEQIEDKLGYIFDYLDDPESEATSTFYSDLTRVSNNPYERALKELDEYTKQNTAPRQQLPGRCLPKVDDHRSFLFEAHDRYNDRKHASGFIFQLPRELRGKIYEFCIPDGKWSVGDVDAFNTTTFAGNIGDPTGFCFPLSKDLAILNISKRIREEVIPIAYRRTFFRLDDIDESVKVAASIGNIGRANVESVEFCWESRRSLTFSGGGMKILIWMITIPGFRPFTS